MRKHKSQFIPVCEPFIGQEEKDNVLKALNTNWISSKGGFIPSFEKKFAQYCGSTYGIATTNGTAALHLALAAAGIKKGDEVIIPAFTMIATAFAITYTGAKPILVDAEPETWNIDPKKIEEKITKRTKAILPVHIYGHPCDMDPILKIARRHNLVVIEDAAEAHGALYGGKKVGGIGMIGCFSFYSNKMITTGEGGMIVTRNKKIADRAQKLKNLSFPKKRVFQHDELGFNYRMTNIQAGIGIAQLKKINKFIKARRSHAHLYNKLLKNIAGITPPKEEKWAKNVYWMYAISVDKKLFGMNRDTLIKKLMLYGIETRTFFTPIHQQLVFKKMRYYQKEKYPVSESIATSGLYLPSGTGLTTRQIKYICSIIKKLEGKKG